MPPAPLAKRAKPLTDAEMRAHLCEEHFRLIGTVPHHRTKSSKIAADIEAAKNMAAGAGKGYAALITDVATFHNVQMDAQCKILGDTQREVKCLSAANAAAAAATTYAARKLGKEETHRATVRARRKLAEENKTIHTFIQGILGSLIKAESCEMEQVLEALRLTVS